MQLEHLSAQPSRSPPRSWRPRSGVPHRQQTPRVHWGPESGAVLEDTKLQSSRFESSLDTGDNATRNARAAMAPSVLRWMLGQDPSHVTLSTGQSASEGLQCICNAHLTFHFEVVQIATQTKSCLGLHWEPLVCTARLLTQIWQWLGHVDVVELRTEEILILLDSP